MRPEPSLPTGVRVVSVEMFDALCLWADRCFMSGSRSSVSHDNSGANTSATCNTTSKARQVAKMHRYYESYKP
ncbi:hypothetical protein NDU88_000636 [Pleurodeles waltl]|uniref:Uncharacterized protein n=1 Tax=Pleurodeles waltl TaxID=8319 RepID=A0AAV7L7F5_PLEWA|nr:hypothetical protein NDU88_000636 [Pleurodeles waltl]